MDINRFTIRVYGLLEYKESILLVHEKIGDFHFTKFPGGGLEFGEGIKDCLIREFKEETGLTVEITDHFYTTDFFQQSAFRKTDQLICVYYKIKAINNPLSVRLDEHKIKQEGQTELLRFFWVAKKDLNEDMVSFPTDKLVVNMIKNSTR